LRVWREREGRVLEKREEQVEKNREHWEGRALGGSFFSMIQNSPHLWELKNCIEGGFT